MALYEEFPSLTDGVIRIKKLEESDIAELQEITDNPRVYQYCPYFLHKKSKSVLLTAIKNLGGRDFEKKKWIIAGVYLIEENDRLIGLAEMFEYKKRSNSMTVGYKFNESYWNRRFATRTVSLIKQYLLEEQGLEKLDAYVMPENVYSARALLSNGFEKLPDLVEQNDWGGISTVQAEHYVCTSSK